LFELLLEFLVGEELVAPLRQGFLDLAAEALSEFHGFLLGKEENIGKRNLILVSREGKRGEDIKEERGDTYNGWRREYSEGIVGISVKTVYLGFYSFLSFFLSLHTCHTPSLLYPTVLYTKERAVIFVMCCRPLLPNCISIFFHFLQTNC